MVNAVAALVAQSADTMKGALVMTTTNAIELIWTNHGPCLARIDGRVWPNRLDRAALEATVGRSRRYRV